MYMMKSNPAQNKGDTRKITKYHNYSSIIITIISYLNPTLYTSLYFAVKKLHLALRYKPCGCNKITTTLHSKPFSYNKTLNFSIQSTT